MQRNARHADRGQCQPCWRTGSPHGSHCTRCESANGRQQLDRNISVGHAGLAHHLEPFVETMKQHVETSSQQIKAVMIEKLAQIPEADPKLEALTCKTQFPMIFHRFPSYPIMFHHVFQLFSKIFHQFSTIFRQFSTRSPVFHLAVPRVPCRTGASSERRL